MVLPYVSEQFMAYRPAHTVEHDQEHAIPGLHHRTHNMCQDVLNEEHVGRHCPALRPIAQCRGEGLIHGRTSGTDGVLEPSVDFRQRRHIFTANERFTRPINKSQVIAITTRQMAYPTTSE
jgi:hypothetical protein